MKLLARTICAVMFFITGQNLYSQKFSVSTDLLGYASLGTMNADVSYAVSRRLSVVAGAVYNPFTFRKNDPQKQFQLRQRSFSAGMRFWPWHIWSGWWFAGKLQYQEYNFGGIISRYTEEGDRFGAGLYSGYTHMLAPHLNIEFGLGLWTGISWYSKYSCPVCGKIEDRGRKWFLLPDDLMISLVYVF